MGDAWANERSRRSINQASAEWRTAFRQTPRMVADRLSTAERLRYRVCDAPCPGVVADGYQDGRVHTLDVVLTTCLRDGGHVGHHRGVLNGKPIEWEDRRG